MCPKDSTTSQDDVLVKHLQEELSTYLSGLYNVSEVLEARKLKLSHENIELLKEKLWEEKVRRERVEAELLGFRDSAVRRQFDSQNGHETQKRKWSSCWSLYWCFSSYNKSK